MVLSTPRPEGGVSVSRALATSVGCVLLLVTLFPFKTTVVPEWRVSVLDERQRPIDGVEVRRTWTYYPYTDVGDTEDIVRTSGDGLAVLPSQTVRLNLLSRGILCCLNLAGGVHSSWGLSASLSVYASGKRRLWLGSPVTEHKSVFRDLAAGRILVVRLPQGGGDLDAIVGDGSVHPLR